MLRSRIKTYLEKLPEEQKTGIFILPSDTPVGIPAKDVLGLNDVVLEFELTANRADCFMFSVLFAKLLLSLATNHISLKSKLMKMIILN